MKVWVAAISACLGLGLGCGPSNAGEGAPSGAHRGLREVRLRLSDDSRVQVMQGGKKKKPVSATLRWGDQEVPGRLSIVGNGSLDHIKKNYRFDRKDGKTLFDSLKLSSQAQDPSFLRMLYGKRLYDDLGIPAPEVEPVWLSINGEAQGLYLMIERINEEFFDRRGIEVTRLYKSKTWRAKFGPDLVVDPRYAFEAKIGEFHESEIRRLAEWAQAAPHAGGLRELEAMVDVEATLRFFSANLFLSNCDGISNNILMYRERGDGRLKPVAWDWDRAFNSSCPPGYMVELNGLYKRMLDYPELNGRFRAHLSRLMDEAYTPNSLAEITREDAGKIGDAHAKDRFLGGMGESLDRRVDEFLELDSRWRSELRAYFQMS